MLKYKNKFENDNKVELEFNKVCSEINELKGIKDSTYEKIKSLEDYKIKLNLTSLPIKVGDKVKSKKKIILYDVSDEDYILENRNFLEEFVQGQIEHISSGDSFGECYLMVRNIFPKDYDSKSHDVLYCKPYNEFLQDYDLVNELNGNILIN